VARLRWLPGLLLLCCGVAGADVIHLKDGRSIRVAAWHYSGDQLVFELSGGTVTIPRSLVQRVEADPSPPPAAPAEAPAATPSVPRRHPPTPSLPSAPPAASGALPPGDDAMRASIESLKRELRDDPLRRESAARQIAALLTTLGNRASQKHDSAAEGLYREALTYDSRFLPALIGLSATYLAEGKDIYARSQIQEALVAYPNDPSLHALLGEVFYAQEDLRSAISEWETSLSLRSDARVSARLEKARREFAVDRDFARSEAPHFTLRYEGGSAESTTLGTSIRDYLEEAYSDLSSRYDFVPPAPFVVLLYPKQEFHDVTQMPSGVGGLFDGKIRVPIGGLTVLTAELRSVLLHELTHAFVFGKTRGNCPRWLQEGLAQWAEGKTLRPSEERRLAAEFTASEGGAWYPGFSYPAALSFTRYLMDRFRFEALLDILQKLGEGASTETALKEITREDFADLQDAWGKELAQRVAGRR
jgi:Peptidase of plants and bacteria